MRGSLSFNLYPFLNIFVHFFSKENKEMTNEGHMLEIVNFVFDSGVSFLDPQSFQKLITFLNVTHFGCDSGLVGTSATPLVARVDVADLAA